MKIKIAGAFFVLGISLLGCDTYVGFDEATMEVLCLQKSPFGPEQPKTCDIFLNSLYEGSDIPERTCCHWYAGSGWYEVWCMHEDSCDWNYLESYYACEVVAK
tara:strand:- start:279 stop:587 length:309 start_codon:yes stop_codon:yes gene_type:complete